MSCKNPFSDLNKQISEGPLIERPDPDEFNLFYQILNVIEQQKYEPDTLKDVATFEAVVYEVFETEVNIVSSFLQTLDNLWQGKFPCGGVFPFDKENYTFYRVYVPGLMPLADSLPPIPDMNQKSNNGNPVSGIDLYGEKYPIVKTLPIATHHIKGLEKAAIGDIARVAFPNIRKFDIVYYMGKSEGGSKAFTFENSNSARSRSGCSKVMPSSKVTTRKEKQKFNNYSDDDIEVPYSVIECFNRNLEKKLSKVNQELKERGETPSKCAKVVSRPSNSQTTQGFKPASTTVEILPAETYKENRVRLDSFAPATEKDKNMVKIPKDLCYRGRDIYAHALVVPRLIAMNEAWLNDYPVGTDIDKVKDPNKAETYFVDQSGNEWKGKTERSGGSWTKPNGEPLSKTFRPKEIIKAPSEGIKVVSGLRKVREHKFGSREAYEKLLKKKYGSVKEGRKYLAWDSPHGTGLALDFRCNGISTRSRNNKDYQKTTFWKWLKNNAHKFGFTPYRAEAWHWELLVPRENWYSGEEFVKKSTGDDRYSYRVRETGTKNNTLTTNREFYKKEIDQ